MKDDERVIKTENQSNSDVDIRQVDTMMQLKVEDDAEILELDNTQELTMADDAEVLDIEEKTEELDLEEVKVDTLSDSDDISDEPSIIDVLEPTEAYQARVVSQDDIILEDEKQVEVVNAEDGSFVAVQEENVESIPTTVNNINKVTPKKYVDYKVRVAMMGVSLVVLFGLYLVFFVSSLAQPEEEAVNYRETSNLDYKVYLKENDFYESNYLDENMVYVASLIDNIAVDFNYRFDINEILNMNLNYDVVGKLIISDTDGKKRYFEKEYQLLDKKTVNISDVDNHSLKETILIDYDYYNGLANQFKMNYGVEAKSTLQIFLKVNKKSNDKVYNINDDSVMSITIPLSTKSVEIEMNYNEIDENRSVVKESIELVHNKLYMALAIIFGLSLIVVAIKLIRFLSSTKVKKSVYDNFVEKLLREYDRLIVENFTGPDLKNSSVVTIKNFDELLDVRDGLRLPILYYIVAKHQKCYFYVKNGNEIYLMTVKAVDLEKESERG